MIMEMSLAAVARPKLATDVLAEIAKENKVKYSGAPVLDLPRLGFSLKVNGGEIEVYVGKEKVGASEFPEDGVLGHGFDAELKEVKAVIFDEKLQGKIRTMTTGQQGEPTKPPKQEDAKVVDQNDVPTSDDIPVGKGKGAKPLTNAKYEQFALKLGNDMAIDRDLDEVDEELNDFLDSNKVTDRNGDLIVDRALYVSAQLKAMRKGRRHSVKPKPAPAPAPTPEPKPKPKPTPAPAQAPAPTTKPTPTKLEKFAVLKPPTVPKAALEAALEDQKFESRKTLLKKLKIRVMGFAKAIGNGTAGEAEIMMFPFDASAAPTKSYKTASGIAITKNQIFGIMAGMTADAPKGTRKEPSAGVYDNVCRICGEELEPQLVVGKDGITFPAGAAAHYKKHGLTMSWIAKNVQDKTTSKIYSVRYIGTLSEVPNSIK
jgi:hypothetical protein